MILPLRPAGQFQCCFCYDCTCWSFMTRDKVTATGGNRADDDANSVKESAKYLVLALKACESE